MSKPSSSKQGDTPLHVRKRFNAHPVLVLSVVLLLCAVLTHVLPSGRYQRNGQQVIQGTYATIEKDRGWQRTLGLSSNVGLAQPAGVVDLFMAVPKGMDKNASLIFMMMFVGGLFGVFKGGGALDASLDWLVRRSRGNLYLLIPLLMSVLAVGSSFLGLISEYLVLLPILMSLGERLKLQRIQAVAILLIAAKIGYLASVSNPIVLPIAQGIVQVPVFSGLGLRLAVLLFFLLVGIIFLLLSIHRSSPVRIDLQSQSVSILRRHVVVLGLLCLAIAFMIYAGKRWHWHNDELSAFYLVVAIVIASVSGLSPGQACAAFVDGMKSMVLPSLLIGMAGAIEVLLQSSLVLDTVVHAMASMIHGQSPWLAALAVMLAEAALTLFIPSTSAKAAISIPILWPIGQLSGLQGNTVVLAYLFGNGLMAMISPTSGLMLAMLAIADVPYGRWFRFVLPLVVLLTLAAAVFLFIAVYWHD